MYKNKKNSKNFKIIVTFNYFYVIIKKIIFQIDTFDGFVKNNIYIR